MQNKSPITLLLLGGAGGGQQKPGILSPSRVDYRLFKQSMNLPKRTHFNLSKDPSSYFLRLAQVFLVGLLFSITQAASLQIQSYPSNFGSLPKNAVRVPFTTLNLKALEGPITVKSLTVERSGLSSHEDFGRIWAETSNYRRTNSRRLSNDDQVVLEFRNGLYLAENQTTRITVLANLEFTSTGRTAQLNILDIDYNGDQAPEPTVEFEADKIRPQTNQAPYDRTRYRIKCTRGKCRLVPRD